MNELTINIYQGDKTEKLTPKINSPLKDLDILFSTLIQYIFTFTERLAKYDNSHKIKYTQPFDIEVIVGNRQVFNTKNEDFDPVREHFKFNPNKTSKLNFINHLYPYVLQHISHPFDDFKFETSVKEGKIKKVAKNVYERNPAARNTCLEEHGYSCKVCDLNFEEYYGSIGAEFIHVHHITPLSSIKKEYNLNPLKDLVPICPNCHAMLHKRNPPFSVEEIKEKINTHHNK